MTPVERENQRYSKGYQNPIEMEEEILFHHLSHLNKGKLLDVGCGEGTVSLELRKHGFEVVGIDFSSVAVKRAKDKGINALELDLDKDGIPFDNNYYDVVWAGDVIEHVGRLEESQNVRKIAMQLAKSTANKLCIASSICSIGGLLEQKGDYKQAMTYFEESLTYFDELGDNDGISKVLGNMGVIYLKTGEYDKAMGCFERDLKICQKLNDKKGISTTIGNMGIVYMDQGKL